jgi:hypothetical protein
LEHGAEEFVGGCAAQFGGDLAEALHDGIDGFIERGGAGGDADVAGVAEPGGIEFLGAFDLQRAQAVAAAFCASWRVLLLLRPPMTTMWSQSRIRSSIAVCRCFVG